MSDTVTKSKPRAKRKAPAAASSSLSPPVESPESGSESETELEPFVTAEDPEDDLPELPAREMSFVMDVPAAPAIFPPSTQSDGPRSPIYNIWNLLDQERDICEAEMRALCQVAYLGDHNALCRVLGRYKMYVDTRDIGISSHLMLDGFWEIWVTKAMMKAVRRGSTVIDIGANLGYFTVLLSDLAGPEGRVLSFEPNPVLAPRLRKSVELNGFASFCKVHEVALGDRPGTARMDVMEHQPGGGRTVASGRGAQAGTIPVQRLDSIPEALDAEFIKIDVEGFEQHVWRGMSGLLKQKRPLTIFMEFTVQRYPDPVGFLKEIQRSGFDLALIGFSGEPEPTSIEALMAGPHNVDHMLALRR